MKWLDNLVLISKFNPSFRKSEYKLDAPRPFIVHFPYSGKENTHLRKKEYIPKAVLAMTKAEQMAWIAKEISQVEIKLLSKSTIQAANAS